MEAICGPSYTGDIRMRWGENKREIQRIVQGKLPSAHFATLLCPCRL